MKNETTTTTKPVFFGVFIESSWKKRHEIFSEAPCEWSRLLGATHTLRTRSYPTGGVSLDGVPSFGTRPVKIAKTRIWVGVDEAPDGTIVWEKWIGRWDVFSGDPVEDFLNA